MLTFFLRVLWAFGEPYHIDCFQWKDNTYSYFTHTCKIKDLREILATFLESPSSKKKKTFLLKKYEIECPTKHLINNYIIQINLSICEPILDIVLEYISNFIEVNQIYIFSVVTVVLLYTPEPTGPSSLPSYITLTNQHLGLTFNKIQKETWITCILRRLKDICLDEKYDILFKGQLHVALNYRKKKIPVSTENFNFGKFMFYKATSVEKISSLFSYKNYLKKRAKILAKKAKEEQGLITQKMLQQMHYSKEDIDYDFDQDDYEDDFKDQDEDEDDFEKKEDDDNDDDFYQ